VVVSATKLIRYALVSIILKKHAKKFTTRITMSVGLNRRSCGWIWSDFFSGGLHFVAGPLFENGHQNLVFYAVCALDSCRHE
jgi:hypothetical protein